MSEPNDTLWDRYRRVAERRASDPAVVDDDGTPVSHGDLLGRSERAAEGLRAIGLQAGDHLGIFLPNRVAWLVAALAAARAGVGVLGLNTRFREAELEHLLALAEVDTVLAPDRFLGLDAPGLLGSLDHPVQVVVDGDRVPAGARRWADVAERPAPDGRESATPPNGRESATPPNGRESATPPGLPMAGHPLIGFTTSGTTGLPKIAMHTNDQTVAHLDAVVDSFGFDRATVALVPLPLCGAFGYTMAMSALLAGGTVVLHETWDADRAAADLARRGVTYFSASDDMLLAVAASPSFPAATTWRTGGFADFTNAGAEAVARLEERSAGTTRLAGLYGSSEGFALMASFDHGAELERRAVNGGHLVGPSMSVRACDPETGTRLGHGEPGELQFRGPNLITGYLNDDGATARAHTDDGWFRSGDLGYTIEPDDRGHEGFVYLARMGDALRLRGFLCDPSEIESHLERHPSVALAQVVGVSRPGSGDVAVAFVQLAADESGAEDDAEAAATLADHCRHGLANYKRPERIVIVDEFPVTDGPNGVKIRKVELRDRAVDLVGGEP